MIPSIFPSNPSNGVHIELAVALSRESPPLRRRRGFPGAASGRVGHRLVTLDPKERLLLRQLHLANRPRTGYAVGRARRGRGTRGRGTRGGGGGARRLLGVQDGGVHHEVGPDSEHKAYLEPEQHERYLLGVEGRRTEG